MTAVVAEAMPKHKSKEPSDAERTRRNAGGCAWDMGICVVGARNMEGKAEERRDCGHGRIRHKRKGMEAKVRSRSGGRRSVCAGEMSTGVRGERTMGAHVRRHGEEVGAYGRGA